WRALPERGIQRLHWIEHAPRFAEAALHVRRHVGEALRDAVVLAGVAFEVEEVAIAALVERFLPRAEVRELDILPALRTDAVQVFVVEEQQLVMRRSSAGGEHARDVQPIK